MVIFYKKWKKYNEFQLTKNKMDLNIRKMTNHPPSPEYFIRNGKEYDEVQLTNSKIDFINGEIKKRRILARAWAYFSLGSLLPKAEDELSC